MQKKSFGIFSKHVFACVQQSALVALVFKIFSQIISCSESQLGRDWVLVFTVWLLTLQPHLKTRAGPESAQQTQALDRSLSLLIDSGIKPQKI